MDNIRKIHHVCRIRLRKTFTTPRFYVALLWVLLEFQGTASGIRAFCKTSGIDAAYNVEMEALNGLILSRFSVPQAMVLTMLAIWILTVMIGMAVYAGNFLMRRGFGVVIGCGIALTALLLSKFSNITIGYYCAPPLWMNIASYKWQGYGNGPSIVYVYSVFAAVIGACTILSYLGIRKEDLNFVEEI